MKCPGKCLGITIMRHSETPHSRGAVENYGRQRLAKAPLQIFQAPAGNGLWAFVELYCLRGTEGENRYGPDPLAG